MADEYTSAWWLAKLSKALDDRAPKLRKYQDYYDGEHPLLFASAKFREAYGGMFREFSDNFCDLVVDAVEERLTVVGFRWPTGRGRAKPSDDDAWAMWQANDLDSLSQLAHSTALIKGCAYGLAWTGGPGGQPLLTIEDPSELIVAYQAGTRIIEAGLKRWRDGKRWYYTLYLPDRIEKYRTRADRGADDPAADLGEAGDGVTAALERREVTGEDWPLRNPLNRVPIVPFINKPRLVPWGSGASEIKTVIPRQDAINKLVTDMIVSSEFTAYRQRWATGIEIPDDPDTGQPVEPFKAAVDRLFISENEEAKFGDFEQSDPKAYVSGIELLIQHIASTTRTPPHYLLGQAGTFPSGESLKATETGLVAKARRKQRHFGEGWEGLIRLGFLVGNNSTKAAVLDGETIWRDPESRTEGEHVDALLKLKSLGIPDEQLWEDAGYSPQQIAKFIVARDEREAKLARAAAAAPPPVPAVVPPAPGPTPPASPALPAPTLAVRG